MQKAIFLFFFLVSHTNQAQSTYLISGEVIDQNNEMMSIGDVLLFQKENDILFTYTTLLEGRFSLDDIPKGNYLLRISCLGYDKVEQILQVDKSIFTSIELKEKVTNLDAVALVAAKIIVTNTNGNLKIDVSNPVFASIPEPMELLGRLPGIQVSADRESLTVIGKGTPLIYMGNQRISLQEFNALSVDEIKSVEIIKNPSSKYEAEGSAVLLITHKITDTEGMKLNFSETFSFKQNLNNYHGLNASFQKDKLTLKANFAYNDLLTWESNTFEFAIPKQNILSNYLVLIDENEREQINTGAGLYYQIDDTDYWSLNFTSSLQNDQFPIDTQTFLRQGERQDSIDTQTLNDNSKNFISVNSNYNSKLYSTITLFTGLQFSSFFQALNTDISNNYNDTEFIRSQVRQQEYRIDVLAYRLDLEKTFKNGLKAETGTSLKVAKADALTNIQFLNTPSVMNIEYSYSESTYAIYSQVSGALNEKLNVMAGVRVENNFVKGKVDNENMPLVDRDVVNFFPKAMLNFSIDSTKSLVLNYAKSIVRPNYSRASSITSFINPILEGGGNVNLIPTVTDEVSAVIQIKNSSLTMKYSQSKNPAFFTIGYQPNTEQAILSLKNLDSDSGFDINLTVPITKGNWTATNSAILFKRRIKDADAEIGKSRPYLYFYTDHQFKIAEGTTISLGGWGFTKSSEGIFNRKGLASFNAAITKIFFKNLHCALRFNDITKAQNFEERYSVNGVIANGTYIADAREIVISLKYALGKSSEPKYESKDIDENMERIR